MGDDLFSNCDCPDCGGCECPDCGDCDCDCFDCDCNCDDCLSGDNVILCCCFPADNNNAGRKNRGDVSPDCSCCCERRSRTQNRSKRYNARKKKGFCCWRLWCCFRRKNPSPPPSPKRTGLDGMPPRGYMRDGRYPMPEDMDFYMHDKWDRHHERDMPSRGYKSGGRYPMHEEMRMYRDEYGPKDSRKDSRSGGKYGSKDYYNRRDGDERGAPVIASRDLKDERNLGKAVKDETKGEESKSVVQDELEIAPHDYGRFDSYSSQGGLDNPSANHGQGAIASGSEEMGIKPYDDDRNGVPHQDRGIKGIWSGPLKYEDSIRQSKP